MRILMIQAQIRMPIIIETISLSLLLFILLLKTYMFEINALFQYTFLRGCFQAIMFANSGKIVISKKVVDSKAINEPYIFHKLHFRMT